MTNLLVTFRDEVFFSDFQYIFRNSHSAVDFSTVVAAEKVVGAF